MKKSCLLVLSLVFASGMIFAQHGRGGGRGNMGNAGQGVGQGRSVDLPQAGRPDTPGKPEKASNPEKSRKGENGKSADQHDLKESQINSGAFRMLERKYPGMTAEQLQSLYRSSGAKSFGQFVSAMVVSKNLNLDYNRVLAGLKTESLGSALQSMGVGKDNAKRAMEQAEKEVRAANRERQKGKDS